MENNCVLVILPLLEPEGQTEHNVVRHQDPRTKWHRKTKNFLIPQKAQVSWHLNNIWRPTLGIYLDKCKWSHDRFNRGSKSFAVSDHLKSVPQTSLDAEFPPWWFSASCLRFLAVLGMFCSVCSAGFRSGDWQEIDCGGKSSFHSRRLDSFTGSSFSAGLQ